ncbi:MAG: ribosome small subunit-dependent GTPase A, partial [Acetatifactor sp.]|nr:ribosome small subunit-dependent GTPase A [Acetatifactor sp.]
TFLVSAGLNQGVDALRVQLAGKTTTVAGPSGVGKSSLVNRLQDKTQMQTGSISEKIDRGRHTTRHTELIAMADDTYILDTPGFSSLGLFALKKEELASFYPEFAQYEKNCRFAGCAHMSEPVCGVRDAVESGDIPRMRYENYRLLYEELREQKRY